MSFFLINDIRLNLPMGWVPFQMLYLGPFSNVRYSYYLRDSWHKYKTGNAGVYQVVSTAVLHEGFNY